MIDPVALVQVIISGAMLGALYGFIGMGLGIIWGVMRIINFSHGAMLVLGGYISYTLFTSFGLLPIQSMLISGAILFALGVSVQRVIDLSAKNRSLIVTLGIALVLESLMTLLWGLERYISIPRGFLESLLTESLKVGPIVFPTTRLEVFILCVAMIAVLYVFLMKTYIGKAVRAVVQNRFAAMLVGVDVKRVYILAFGIGCAINGIAGSLIPMITPISPGAGLLLLGKSFAVAIVVIIARNIAYIFYAGLILGLAENIFTLFVPVGFKDLVFAAMLIAILLAKPYVLVSEERD